MGIGDYDGLLLFEGEYLMVKEIKNEKNILLMGIYIL